MDFFQRRIRFFAKKMLLGQILLKKQRAQGNGISQIGDTFAPRHLRNSLLGGTFIFFALFFSVITGMSEISPQKDAFRRMQNETQAETTTYSATLFEAPTPRAVMFCPSMAARARETLFDDITSEERKESKVADFSVDDKKVAALLLSDGQSFPPEPGLRESIPDEAVLKKDLLGNLPLSILMEIFLLNIDCSSATNFIDSIKKLISLKSVSKKLRGAIDLFLTKNLGRLNLDAITDKNGSNVFHVTIQAKHPLSFLKLLFENVKKPTDLLMAQKADGVTPLHWVAVLNENPEMFRILLSMIPELERSKALSAHDRLGRTPLHWAVALTKTNPGVMRIMLSMLSDRKRPSLLFVQNNIKTKPSSVIVAKQIDPAALYVILNLIPRLKRSEILLVRDNDGITPLHWGALTSKCNPDILRVILQAIPAEERMAALLALDNRGATPLYLAASRAGPEILCRPVAQGADPEQRSNVGCIIYGLIPQEQHTEITKIIKDALTERMARESQSTSSLSIASDLTQSIQTRTAARIATSAQEPAFITAIGRPITTQRPATSSLSPTAATGAWRTGGGSPQ